MIPIRVTAPIGPVVSVEELQEHLRVVGNHDAGLIQSLEAAVVSHLDGWRGTLGRCILEQQWRVDYPGAGLWRLPLPDVTEVSAINADTDPVEAVLSHDGLGSLVKINEAASVTLTAALPEDALEAVRVAIKIWVHARYDGLEGSAAVASDTAFKALIDPLRRVLL